MSSWYSLDKPHPASYYFHTTLIGVSFAPISEVCTAVILVPLTVGTYIVPSGDMMFIPS